MNGKFPGIVNNSWQASLIATVAITSLQSTELEEIQWSVTAVWTASLVFSIVSLISSLMTSVTLVGCPKEDLADFFSGIRRSRSVSANPRLGTVSEKVKKKLFSYVMNSLTLPLNLLHFALVTYLVGLGMFWLFKWIELEQSRSRNVS